MKTAIMILIFVVGITFSIRFLNRCIDSAIEANENYVTKIDSTVGSR